MSTRTPRTIALEKNRPQGFSGGPAVCPVCGKAMAMPGHDHRNMDTRAKALNDDLTAMLERITDEK